MSFPYQCPGPHTLTIDVGGANGQSVNKSAIVALDRRKHGGEAANFEFNGPDVASCGASGDTVTLSYSYRTKNATAVEPEIDGEIRRAGRLPGRPRRDALRVRLPRPAHADDHGLREERPVHEPVGGRGALQRRLALRSSAGVSGRPERV